MSFGLTTTSSNYTVDTGGGLVFSILRGGTLSSTIHLGDLTSAVYNGVETLAPYSSSGRYSHYEEGLGNAVVSATVDPNGQWIKITADDSAETSGGVIQYYIAHKGDPNLYMASLPTDVNNGPGEGRFIAYMNRSVFTHIEQPSNISQGTAIEGSDVFGNADGTTASKFYDMNRRIIDNSIHGITGTNIGAFMTMGNRETASGGPFFKDIDFQTTSSATEMYNCLFTGHTQTESFRQGLKGPYALMFTTGATPALPNYSFLEGVGIQGLTPASQRGSISGTASGVPSGHQVVVGLSSSTAQYWAYANGSTGAYTISGVLPGTYTETLYDTELAVGTKTVTIATGANTAANIADTFYVPSSPIFRLGTWDGTPLGFLNSENDATYGLPKISIMHPSDVRMDSWTATPNFIVGTNTDSQWPLAQFMGVNNSQRISFSLTPAQVQNLTLRVGITWGFSGARPQVTVNGGQSYSWTSTIPSASADLNSRGITRGTWRGVNQLYTYPIPASALVAGTNTIDLPLVSGSYVSGQTWLSPNIAYDAIDLVPTTAASTPVIASVTITPTNSIGANGTRTFTAVARDANGNVLSANFDWSAARGTIDPSGNYTAPSTGGQDTISVTANEAQTSGYNTTSSRTSAFGATLTGTGSTIVQVVDAPPTVATAPSASPNPVYSLTSSLSVLGADDNGESNLTYTWSAPGTQPGTVSFSANSTNAAKSTTATFSGYGTYNLLVTITDSAGNTVTAPLSVVVRQYVAHYLANETAGSTLHDSSPSGNDATLSGSYSFVAGQSGNALNLAGGVGGGYATLPNGIASSLTSFTVATWIKPSAVTDWMRVFDFGSNTNVYMFLTPQYGPNGFLRFAIKNGGAEQVIDSTTKISAGVWTHVAITLSGSTGILYVNGAQVGSSSSLSINPSQLGSTVANYIGKSQFTGDPMFAGLVDDFRMYGRALSSSEIQVIASNPIPSAPVGLSATPVNGSGQINLAWSSTAGAATYNLYRSAAPGGPYALIASAISSLNYQDTALAADLANGTHYYYVLSAQNAGGEGPQSTQASALLLPPPPASPTSFNVQLATTASLALSWDAPANAASYSLTRSTSANGPYTTLASGITSTSYTDTALTNGQSYFYTLSSHNAAGAGANSPVSSGVPTDLYDYQKFDETSGATASDASGHGFTATLNNGPAWSSGKLGGSINLNGSGQYVSLPSGIVSALTATTLCAWVNLSSLSTWMRIFDFGSGANNYMFLSPQAGGSNALRFAITTSGNANEQQINASAPLATNAWTHVAVVLSGSVGTLYVNGVQAGQNTAMTLSASSLGSTTQNYIGKSQFNDPYLAGLVDDFRIYSRALSASELASLAANTPPAAANGVTATIAHAQANLSWPAVAGASSYSIQRSFSSGGPYSSVGSVAASTSFADSSLTDGLSYYYVVLASNLVGSGPASSPLNVIPAPISYLGSSARDTYSLRLDPVDNSLLQIFVNTPPGSSPSYEVKLVQVPWLSFDGSSGGADALTVDYANGNPLAAGGVSFNAGDSLNINGSANADAFLIDAGHITRSAWAGTISYSNLAHVQFSLLGGTDSLTQTAQPLAALSFSGTGGNDSLNINAGSFSFPAPAAAAGIQLLQLGTLSIGAGASVLLPTAISHSDRWAMLLGSLTLGGWSDHWSGQLDLGGNDLIVRGGSAVNLSNQIKQGYATGSFSGQGIISSTAQSNPSHQTTLGLLNNGGPVYSSFDNQSVTAADVLIKYTYYGDANLDGTVNSSDYSQIDNGFNLGSSGWYNGDFNDDGTVNSSDYSLIDNAFNQTQGTSLSDPSALLASSTALIANPASALLANPASASCLQTISSPESKFSSQAPWARASYLAILAGQWSTASSFPFATPANDSSLLSDSGDFKLHHSRSHSLRFR